ncbi:MAG: hypothetical protein HZA81_02435 [Candidatus Taylorbacteria bacterium]|nr:hypothetical protein [Candidatus Taylorbacteria bacterium]
MEKDPIKRIEDMVKDIHDRAGSITQPVLRRYPLVFAFLLTFSVAAFSKGFSETVGEIPIVDEHPWILFIAGALALGLTGTLYKALQKID